MRDFRSLRLVALLWLLPALTFGQVSNQQALSQVGATLVRTLAEIAASVTPTNYGYAPGNAKRYGADPTGTNDSTTALQNCINANSATTPNACYVPTGTYKFSAITMPAGSLGFALFGDGSSSVLKQTGTGISWPSTGTNPAAYNEHYIRSLGFIGTSGTGHTIDTTYGGGVTLLDLYETDNPPNFAFIRVAGNTASTGDKYTHDVRLSNIQIYSHTASGEGILFDSTTSDTSLDRFIMNGNGLVPYNILMANGAQSVNISNSHPYNAATNILLLQGGASTALGMTFNNVIFDNVSTGNGDNVVLNNARTATFNGGWLEVVHTGKNAVTLTNSIGVIFNGVRFDGQSGAAYIVNETGTSDYTSIRGGDSPSVGNFNNPAVNFLGTHSSISSFIAVNPFGQLMAYTGASAATIPTNSTGYLGTNGFQTASPNATAWMANLVSGIYLQRCDIAFGQAPGVSQSYTFTLVVNGVTVTAASGSANPQVVSGTGVFSTSIIVAQGANAFAAQYQQFYIQLVTTNGAASPYMRYACTATG